MSIAKTRKELKLLGVLLLGPIVPEWFKRQSDGGSVPLGWFGRFVFNERQWRAAAYIHDFWYYLIALLWDPEYEESDWVSARMKADFELKQNRKAVAKHRIIGWAWGRIIYRGLRVGGAGSVRSREELVVPPTPAAITEIEACIRDMHLQITQQAWDVMAKWRREVE
jgi:hypothetical protein